MCFLATVGSELSGLAMDLLLALSRAGWSWLRYRQAASKSESPPGT